MTAPAFRIEELMEDGLDLEAATVMATLEDWDESLVDRFTVGGNQYEIRGDHGNNVLRFTVVLDGTHYPITNTFAKFWRENYNYDEFVSSYRVACRAMAAHLATLEVTRLGLSQAEEDWGQDGKTGGTASSRRTQRWLSSWRSRRGIAS